MRLASIRDVSRESVWRDYHLSNFVSRTAHLILPLLFGYSYFLVASPRDASGGESLPFAYLRPVIRIG